MKLFTEIPLTASKLQFTLKDKIMMLGSCFADNIAMKLKNAGFELISNPFGTLYNPESIANAIRRLDSEQKFCEADCVSMGSGANMICSFEHHTSFARPSAAEFLEHANSELEQSSKFWKECNKVIITYGTARVWKHHGKTVSNCLKIPSTEFTRELLSLERIEQIVEELILSHPEKEFLFTISPIRYLSDGPQGNSITKALLHLGLQKLENYPKADYFPAYEIVIDELRDYRFYSSDLIHPNESAIDYLWEKFLKLCVPKQEHEAIRLAEKKAKMLGHRSILSFVPIENT